MNLVCVTIENVLVTSIYTHATKKIKQMNVKQVKNTLETEASDKTVIFGYVIDMVSANLTN